VRIVDLHRQSGGFDPLRLGGHCGTIGRFDT
jgi:hypothetical protein